MPYIAHQLDGARRLNTPLLKIFGDMPDEQIIQASIPGHTDFLVAAENNRLKEMLFLSMERWVNDQLEIVGRDEIEAEDITQVSHLRKAALTEFLPEYTNDPRIWLGIVKEIDTYQLQADTMGANTYINILRSRISEHSHFIERITNTSPGFVYVYDIVNQKEIYTNEKATTLFGYSSDELKLYGQNVLSALIHPDDANNAKTHLTVFADVKDGEVMNSEYRIRNRDGAYKWVRAYESIFKRDHRGAISQIIGIALDITEEKLRSEALKHNEEQLLEAQQIADLGNFEWDLTNKTIEVSPHLLKVLDLDRKGDFEYFIKKVHP
ncbi:MAG: PAS domain S-box protein, partial [Pedobacter sp.]